MRRPHTRGPGPVRISDLATIARAVAANKVATADLSGLGKSLWPAELSEDTAAAAKAFVFGHCYSYEETSGVAMAAPDHEYLHWVVDEWFETKARGELLAIEKSRRLWVSWLLCALDVWDAGRRQIVIVEGGATYDKAADFVYRCWYIYDQLKRRNPSWELPEPETWGNLQTRRLDRLALETGSVFETLNSDGESFRGSGYARVKLEELSSYRRPADVTSQAAAVTAGPPGAVGGHIVAVSNPSASDEWQELKAPPPGHVLRLPYDAYRSVAGNRCIRIHYAADPLKTPEWVAKERVRGGWIERKWRLEMELDDTIHDGFPVYEDYIEAIHCPAVLKSRPWELTPGAVYVLGLDAGDTLWPGAVLLEVGPEPWHQIVAVAEWTFQGNTPMSRALPKILGGYDDARGKRVRGLQQILPGVWDDVEWVGDQTITKRQGGYGNTSQKVAHEHGVRIRPMSNILDPRLAAVDWALTDWIDNETPRFYVCGHECPMLLKGFQGAYKCMDIPNKPSGHDRRTPDKNVYSHIHDGLQYGMLRAREIVAGIGTRKSNERRRR